MAKKSKKDDFILTASGYKYDTDLVKVSIKVIPALQALIANQLDLMELVKKLAPEQDIFLERHMTELSGVEEEIARSYSKHIEKKEAARAQREEKAAADKAGILEKSLNTELESSGSYNSPLGEDALTQLDRLADRLSPGLPSAAYEKESKVMVREPKVDVGRIALGASIKVLENFLARPLSEEEMITLEQQVAMYL